MARAGRTDAQHRKANEEQQRWLTNTGSAEWKGDLKGGKGAFTVGENVHTGSSSFKSRFEGGEGANPEKLIAAAHASCYSMALANMLAEAGHTADSVNTDASVELEVTDDGPTITKIDLTVRASVPGISEEDFTEHAEAAKEGCPLSKALAGVSEINLDASLSG